MIKSTESCDALNLVTGLLVSGNIHCNCVLLSFTYLATYATELVSGMLEWWTDNKLQKTSSALQN